MTETDRPGTTAQQLRERFAAWVQFGGHSKESPGAILGDALEYAAKLEETLRDIVDFCDDPNGSEKPETLARGLARLLPAAREALARRPR